MPVNANMTLDIDVCESSDYLSFNVTDETGIYSASNSGGYGTPNFAISDAIDSRLVITLPDTTSVTITTFPSFPDSTGNIIVTITAAQLGVTTLADGIYTILYQVDFNNSNNQTIQKKVTKTVIFLGQVTCCIHKLINKVAESDCNCESTMYKNASLSNLLLKSLCGCTNITKTTNILNRLNKLCNSQNCNCN